MLTVLIGGAKTDRSGRLLVILSQKFDESFTNDFL